MIQWTLAGIAVIVVAFLAAAVVGGLQPREHRVTRSADIARPMDSVWAVISDFASLPRWMPGVKAAAPVPAGRDGPRWRLETSEGPMTLEVVESAPPRRLVTRIVDEGQPFGGTWTYELAPTASGTRITITEDGWISNPLFRFFARYVFGLSRTMDETLASLQTRMAEE